MARTSKLFIDRSDEDEDEFPDIQTLVSREKSQIGLDAPAKKLQFKAPLTKTTPLKPTTTVRRRKLGALASNLLLMPWAPEGASNARDKGDLTQEKENSLELPRRGVKGKTEETFQSAVVACSNNDDDEEFVSAQEDVSSSGEASAADDTLYFSDSNHSVFEEDGNGIDSDEDFILGNPHSSRPSGRPRNNKRFEQHTMTRPQRQNSTTGVGHEGGANRVSTAKTSEPRHPGAQPTAQKARGMAKKVDKDLADTLFGLRLNELEKAPREREASTPDDQFATPPSTPPKSRPRLVSPKKLPRIPNTPHRPSSDMFWSQDFIDDWNDEHSPRKQLFPDAITGRDKSPTKPSPRKRSESAEASKRPSDREAKKAFEKAKHDLAEKFLCELDTVITKGKLAQLTASTGGVRLVWSNKLKTTAGRAQWKGEKIRSATAPDAGGSDSKPEHRHHAWIELAEKVIDDQERLVNVLAHEFCHLANFMVSGVTDNARAHGREFKAWAAQVSRQFADRGITVTTKHSYDINFKYVWQCVACGVLYNRHSKSIDPSRHRCGACRGQLEQIKPVPSKKKQTDGEPAKISEYQAFMKEHMRLLKEENPTSPQKEIMKMVASRWKRSKSTTPEEEAQE